MKKLKTILVAVGITVVLGTMGGVNASARRDDNDWGMNLLPAKISNTDDDSWNTYDGGAAKISLTRIVDGPSYYCKARAENAHNEARSSYVRCHQGSGYYTLSGVAMSDGYEYKVRAYNDTFETSSRWAYGNFTW
ncbi:hypothetical protein SAMN04487886_12123 [Clostridium sp. DSM 8431]|uniref:hypothetical protein n=1 Tax=Clostridium sp. DSM 8431 TaxID=1761781 RepID=UPI0008E9B483|nr:hypothetical protein [Clostridium sp. DSM 8431]SFU84095.1 hypothetical protein SAMN04487886_12123 [Clostridium sp. DSM 8431]